MFLKNLYLKVGHLVDLAYFFCQITAIIFVCKAARLRRIIYIIEGTEASAKVFGAVGLKIPAEIFRMMLSNNGTLHGKRIPT